MRGHEYIRDEVRGFLESTVPLFLAAHLADLGESEPAPASVSYLLADSLQELPADIFPVVAVRSTDSVDDQPFREGVWGMVYTLQVMVACDHRTYGATGYEQASRYRDRLLLAVREALYRVSGVKSADEDGDIEFLPGKRPERTGKGNQETLAGVALAAGTIDFRVRVTEMLGNAGVPTERIDGVDLSVSGVDAGQVV